MKLEITPSNYTAAIEKSESTPLFLFLFSPLCSHCTKVEPEWRNVEDFYAFSTDVMLGSINCYEYQGLCKDLKINAYPSFIRIFRGNITQIYPERTFEGIKKEVSNTQQIYPHFVVNMSNKKYESEFPISQIIEEIPRVRSAITVSNENTGDFMRITAFLSPTQAVPYNGDGTIKSIKSFINDFSLTPLGDWSRKDLRGFRRVVLLAANEHDYDSFREVAQNISPRCLIGKISPAELSSIIPTPKDSLPIAVEINTKSSSYRVSMDVRTPVQLLRFIFEPSYTGKEIPFVFPTGSLFAILYPTVLLTIISFISFMTPAPKEDFLL